jgi:hypothetical protein
MARLGSIWLWLGSRAVSSRAVTSLVQPPKPLRKEPTRGLSLQFRDPLGTPASYLLSHSEHARIDVFGGSKNELH